jgi:hypothetical protein
VQRSSSVAKRLGTIGVAAFVTGAVLLGTGIAASAKTTAKAASAGALKKKTTTTTTTTVPPTTTTLPCNGVPMTASATKGQGTATADPATCLVDGTPVAMTASGMMPASATNFLGTFIECNSDPGQPTVSILGNTIPVSCSGALAHTFTPNADGSASATFDAIEGTTGPACAPSLCAPAKNPVDSSGGNPFTDAANYPCPPTTAQLAAGDICVLAVGDTGGDQITIPIAFNLNAPITPATVSTQPPAVAPSGSATTVAPAKAGSTKASSGALAFTGSGPGLWWLALVGIMLMVLGGLLLTVVDQPRRLLRMALRRSRDDS